jgi:hypothetical protein
MSTKSFPAFLLHAPVLLVVGVGCVSTDVDPPINGGGMSNTGGDTSTGGSIGGNAGTGGTGDTGGGGAGGAPAAPAAVFRCEDPGAPKLTSPGDSPLIVDFEVGMLAGANFGFTGGENGGTYSYQSSADQAVLTLSLVPDRNGGQALGLVLTNVSDYGGGMGIYFFPCIDASVYTGITLWARGSVPERTLDGMTIPAGTVTINLDVAEVRTSSRDSIGCAMDEPVDMTLCTRPETTFVVSDTWTQFTFAWADFEPGNKNGAPVVPNGDNLLGINLALDNAVGITNDLELAIDDVAFLP